MPVSYTLPLPGDPPGTVQLFPDVENKRILAQYRDVPEDGGYESGYQTSPGVTVEDVSVSSYYKVYLAAGTTITVSVQSTEPTMLALLDGSDPRVCLRVAEAEAYGDLTPPTVPSSTPSLTYESTQGGVYYVAVSGWPGDCPTFPGRHLHSPVAAKGHITITTDSFCPVDESKFIDLPAKGISPVGFIDYPACFKIVLSEPGYLTLSASKPTKLSPAVNARVSVYDRAAKLLARGVLDPSKSELSEGNFISVGAYRGELVDAQSDLSVYIVVHQDNGDYLTDGFTGWNGGVGGVEILPFLSPDVLINIEGSGAARSPEDEEPDPGELPPPATSSVIADTFSTPATQSLLTRTPEVAPPGFTGLIFGSYTSTPNFFGQGPRGWFVAGGRLRFRPVGE